ncbi:MAG: methyltransferase domain-containing protein [Burkholderiaceae bacterium]|nr:class I SAM-dependent methyltransferase [Gammaproteobacteria bacterium]
MTKIHPGSVKQNVRQFENDVRESGRYAYTGNRLSARLANARITRSIAESFDFRGSSVLDLGCGDGAYTIEFPALGVRKIVGVDPAAEAIEAARARAQSLGVSNIVSFEVGNIYALSEYLIPGRFDCIVIRGVLHHLPDPACALAGLSLFRGTVVVLEPNGNNPVLKLLERFSRYHIEHEERSFCPGLICSWLATAGLTVRSCRPLNLVPFFCPDPIAKALRIVEPLVERTPLLRDIACGQSIIVACA